MPKRVYKTAFTTKQAVAKMGKKYMKQDFRAASMSAKDVKYINGRVTSGPQGPELKQFDTIGTATAVANNTPLNVDLTGLMPQGVTTANRIGERIKIKSIYLKINMRISEIATTGSYGKWALVLDKQQNAAYVSTVGTIFTPSNSNLNQINVQNLERFQVLATGSSSQRMLPACCLGETWEKYVKADIGVRYPETTGYAVTNGLYLIFTTDAPNTVNNPLIVDYNVRIKYSDE